MLMAQGTASEELQASEALDAAVFDNDLRV
jgi:hypothetical protein